MADIKPNVMEQYDSPAEQAEDARTNKLESKGLTGSNRVVTTQSGGPFAGDKFGASVVNKQTTIAPVTPHMVDPNNC